MYRQRQTGSFSKRFTYFLFVFASCCSLPCFGSRYDFGPLKLLTLRQFSIQFIYSNLNLYRHPGGYPRASVAPVDSVNEHLRPILRKEEPSLSVERDIMDILPDFLAEQVFKSIMERMQVPAPIQSTTGEFPQYQPKTEVAEPKTEDTEHLTKKGVLEALL